MKVKALKLGASPDGIIRPGDIRDVPDEEGMQLIQGRYAELVPDAPVVDEAPEYETTDADPPTENTDARPGRKRRWAKE